MILFEEDWQYYPDAIIDTQTKNQSFVRLSALYREMGISNHTFILQLHNPALQGIDPHDPNLPIETMLAIAVECKVNFFYYIREVVRDPNGSKEFPLTFRANRGNIALFWLFFNHVTVCLIQCRQSGKSFSTDTLMSYLVGLCCTNTQINLLTKDDHLRGSNLERLKDIQDELPFYLKQRGKGDIANTEELTVRSLGNRYVGFLPNKSIKAAGMVARGETAPIYHIDELAFFYNIAISLPAALAGGTAARDIAAAKGTPYGTILTTTAGKKDDPDGKFAWVLLCESAIWTEKFFDSKDMTDLHKLVTANSPTGELRVNCTFSHRQLGYTDEWLAKAMKAAISKGEDAARDYLNEWTSGSELSPLSKDQSELLSNQIQLDFYNEISSPYSYITRWFIPAYEIASKMASGPFIMGLDTSDAAGGDDIAMTIRDVKTGAIVAAGNYNETNIITFAEWLCQWLERFPTLTMIIERRSTGSSIIDYLLLMLPARGIDPFARLYNTAVQDADAYPDRFKELSKPMFARSPDVYVKYKRLFGWATSATGATSRTELYSTTLLNAVKMSGDRVYDPKVTHQILGLIIKNGRVDHASGEHDDLCIAWLLTYWLLSQGKHLSAYGIQSKDILVNNRFHKETNNPLVQFEQHEHEQNMYMLDKLVDDIKNERDDHIAYKLEIKLKMLLEATQPSNTEYLSVDSLINSIREHRKQARSKTKYW